MLEVKQIVQYLKLLLLMNIKGCLFFLHLASLRPQNKVTHVLLGQCSFPKVQSTDKCLCHRQGDEEKLPSVIKSRGVY